MVRRPTFVCSIFGHVIVSLPHSNLLVNFHDALKLMLFCWPKMHENEPTMKIKDSTATKKEGHSELQESVINQHSQQKQIKKFQVSRSMLPRG